MSLMNVDDALGLRREQVREKYKAYLSSPFASIQVLLNFDRQYVKAKDTRVWDAEGKEYLDFVAGYGSVNVGHNHPRVLEALKKIENTPKIMPTALQQLPAALAHNLAEIAPGELCRTFFCSSGTEAVEGAIKIARAATGRRQLVSTLGGFHGKSMGALSVSGRDKYKTPFEPLVPECVLVPYGDASALEDVLREQKAAAFIVELIQGEGGIIVPPAGYIKNARELCTRCGTLFIADEVQTGMGRTGHMFACEGEEIVPDIICLAKSFGGGVIPAGAYLTTEDVFKKAYSAMDRALLHTSTFGGYWGNAMACAAAIATINVLVEENLPQRASEMGEYLLGQLRKLKETSPVLKDVRGRGLLIGLEFEHSGQGFLSRFSSDMSVKTVGDFGHMASLVAVDLANRHRILTVYTLNNPNVIRLEPPLTVTREECDRVIEALAGLLKQKKGFLGAATSTLTGALRIGKK
ncbi:MAG: aspartate aminotransferase family protein [Desulforudis sp.]|jgi:putrescine aminotransferase|nr:MAG: aspartate aminotransferase family protein [Desulforudis sp.]